MGTIWRNQFAALGGVFLVEQLGGGNLGEFGIGHVPRGVGEGEAHGFDEEVPAVGAGRVVFGKIEAFEDVEGDEGGDAVAVGGTFPDADITVDGANGVFPGGFVGSEIGFG